MSLYRWLLERDEPDSLANLGRIRGREFYGPAAIPIAALAVSLFGVGETISSQNAANNASKANQANQASSEAAATAEANQLAQPVSLQPILDAQKGGVNSFLSSAGGVPNIGALAKSLFGDSISQALNAALSANTQNAQAAANIYSGVGNSYGLAARNDGLSGTAAGAGLASGLGGVLTGIKGLSPPASPGATPAGGTGVSVPTIPGGTGALDQPSGPPGFAPDIPTPNTSSTPTLTSV
jgi:hypothetical protein